MEEFLLPLPVVCGEDGLLRCRIPRGGPARERTSSGSGSRRASVSFSQVLAEIRQIDVSSPREEGEEEASSPGGGAATGDDAGDELPGAVEEEEDEEEEEELLAQEEEEEEGCEDEEAGWGEEDDGDEGVSDDMEAEIVVEGLLLEDGELPPQGATPPRLACG